ncbi:MAG: chemosensory pili system protein ChpC [Planctomycetota bacterium]|jgi:chemosensory pili system protein ChpC
MSENNGSVRCMLLPLTSISLLIPNSAVAEIIGFSTPRKISATSDWFSGAVLWRGVYIPVVSVEQMCGLGVAGVGPRARIAIIYNPEKDADLPYLGIHMQDIPRAYLADSNTIESTDDAPISEYLLCQIDEDQLVRAIPDLDKIIVDLKIEFTPERIAELSR